MKKIKFTESQIVKILKDYENGIDVQVLCREHGISKATIYNWRKKYSGIDSSQLKRLKELEEENRKLKQMYADLSMDNVMLNSKIYWEKSSKALQETRTG